MTKPEIVLTPAAPSLDTPLQIRVNGLPPGAETVLTATQPDQTARPWTSSATFVAGPSGELDLSTDAPIAGYAGADPMGLVWSMTRGRKPRGAERDRRLLPPAELTLSVEATVPAAGGRFSASAVVQRHRWPDGVRRATVSGRGLVGTLFWRGDDGPRPGILVLGGSEGGLHELDAALLAARGFTVLALAYFGRRGLPRGLVSIPLEYFRDAITFLTACRSVLPGGVGVLGASRGGEAALLTACADERVRAVVSVVGSAVMTQGIPAFDQLDTILAAGEPSWTLGGQTLPFVPQQVTPRMREQIEAREPVDLALAYDDGLADADQVAAAAIPLQRTRAAVLVATAGDDRMWPCGRLSTVPSIARHVGSWQQLDYPEAGHLVAAPPYGPSTDLVTGGPGVRFATGGSAAANAAARADLWPRIIDFFAEQLPHRPD
ncbi:Palmitoyl-CoA hydrolase [Kribbella flavida DSM 17836]|uniref:Palmitoyl-CoA hydrolase n=1 Tax=Kribbella flavida (strain DSM 17836 / JCM 10339 / NBRC 14399) TaxID=479435 RepID=D2PSN7_KRIFD|nr:acyl-CoA thioester hydrolase/BAAT C-terminal domain-containing protein [Kribbella flavida]ADB33175.1 Palmitoyl-CoA hydrolase [Kribbella flavida DSM 17836]